MSPQHEDISYVTRVPSLDTFALFDTAVAASISGLNPQQG